MILSETRRDVLTELINVGLGRAAGVMNTMTGLRVRLDVPKVELLSAEEIELAFTRRFGERVSSVCLDFDGGFAGRATLVFPDASAIKLVAALHGVEWDPRGEMPELPEGADPVGDLEEIGNILINNVLGAVANGLRQRLDYSVPVAAQQTVHDLIAPGEEGMPKQILAATTGFCVERLQLDGLVTLLFQVGSVERLMEALDAVSFGS